MSFLSYSIDYYSKKINEYENSYPTEAVIYEAKQLLKMLDDLTDEGYFELYRQVENGFAGITRLLALISGAGEKPFELKHRDKVTDCYDEETELNVLLNSISESNGSRGEPFDALFLRDLHEYSGWIPYRKDTAYIFLLRDALLPYLFFRKLGRDNLYPWLISRSFTNSFYPGAEIDDVIRGAVFDALENGNSSCDAFLYHCRRKILQDISDFPLFTDAVRRLLSGIPQSHITVVESGCYGTFPLLLYALDDRVDFRMFTTVPFLRDVFGERIFTAEYEKNRLFETLLCQDGLFRFSAFRNGCFYVNINTDNNVKQRSLQEISGFLSV